MSPFPYQHATAPSALWAAARRWPDDTQLKRRRSVLFAFTFSPPIAHA